MDEKAFYDRLKQYHNILFLCHKNADVDSLGSAYALTRAFGGTIGVEDSLSTMAGMLAARLNINTIIKPDLAKYDITVVVDTSNLVQTGYHAIEKCAVIDHHEPGDLIQKCEFYISRKASSTSEMVFDIYRKNGLAIDAELAFALLLALVTDTGHFRYASAEAFEMAAVVLKEGNIPFATVLDFLTQVPVDISSRIAVLKAATRLTLTREGDHLIVTSKVSSFGAQAASSLVSLGADVALVGSESDGEKRISGRVRRGVNLDLAVMLNEVGKQFGGSGGGHAAAAGVVIKGNLDAALGACVAEAIKILTAERAQSLSHDQKP
jgi:nanoRNase/pAp phosphatase (c-di-AMP/oligoRNAs hydrolase)